METTTLPLTKPQQAIFVYRLKTGGHIENGLDGKEVRYHQSLDVGYGPGVFRSYTPDLAVRWPEKFDRMHPDQLRSVAEAAEAGFDPSRSNTGESSPPVPPVQPVVQAPRTKEEFFAIIDKMTLKELQGVAIEREVETKGCKTREEFLKAIKAEAEE